MSNFENFDFYDVSRKIMTETKNNAMADIDKIIEGSGIDREKMDEEVLDLITDIIEDVASKFTVASTRILNIYHAELVKSLKEKGLF